MKPHKRNGQRAKTRRLSRVEIYLKTHPGMKAGKCD